jgi:hypothetical protein
MDAVAVAARAASQLVGQTEELAEAITQSLYVDMPELTARYGSIGREKCRQDLRHTIEHLIPGVHLAEPEMFASYVRWLDDLLRARNVSTQEIVRSLQLTEQIVRTRLPADEADAIATCVRAGLSALGVEAKSGT